MKPQWYIHRFRDLYAEGCSAEIQVNRGGTIYTAWVRAVCEPYTAGSLFAAWEVLRGRAFAFEWPKPGDIEKITGEFQTRSSALSSGEQEGELTTVLKDEPPLYGAPAGSKVR